MTSLRRCGNPAKVAGCVRRAVRIGSPMMLRQSTRYVRRAQTFPPSWPGIAVRRTDRKSTRLNSSHVEISYAVFCLKKKKNTKNLPTSKKIKNTHTLHQLPIDFGHLSIRSYQVAFEVTLREIAVQ